MNETITCEECGKVRGEGEVGKHWICEDCQMDTQKLDNGNDEK